MNYEEAVSRWVARRFFQEVQHESIFLYTTDDDPWFRVEATVIDRRECFGQKKGCSILVCRIDPDSWEDCQWVKRKR